MFHRGFKRVYYMFQSCRTYITYSALVKILYQTCKKKLCTDVDALWNFVSRHSSVKHNHIIYLSISERLNGYPVLIGLNSPCITWRIYISNIPA